MISFKSIKKKIRNIKGNSLAEFAVTTAMMAYLLLGGDLKVM